jgi:tetratricopeptide (TPR) repeat protein/mono/diheme cytochrome c family protein
MLMVLVTRFLSGLVGASLLSGSAAADTTPAELAVKARAILQTHCHRCHGQNGTNEGGFNFVLDRARLVSRKKIAPGDPAKSRLFGRMTSSDDPMPPEGEKPRPAADEIDLVRRWIDAGAPDANAVAPERAFISPEDVARSIRSDLEAVPERERKFTRYFTMTHLANAGLSADEMQSYRHGLSKLVNSLSRGSQIVAPGAVDPAGTLFRIDLRDYQWNEKTWDTVLAHNPYGVVPASEAVSWWTEATGCRLPYVRADWFVAAAARPPLYHEILQLPACDTELEKELRVDVAENIRQERVARAGFNGSGVSRNNRLIERHESGNVVYWKSYDFTSNTGRHNLFAHPIGPGDGPNDFKQDGGEIIFNLPNGLQAYLLVDGQGRRIDKGPTAVVSDPRRPDRAVENGLSCMSCHAKGMIEKADQIRDHANRNPGAFCKADGDTIRVLYPSVDKMTTLLRQDARRFQEAVTKTGAPLSATEPVAVLALRFESELDLSLAAAEAGVRPETLLKTLQRSPALARELGSLRVEGGTVQRQVFVDIFGDLVEELKLGTFLVPRSAAATRAVRRGEALLAKGDMAGALRAYDEAVAADANDTAAHLGRADAYRLSGDLGRALTDYDEALRLDPRSALARNNRGLIYHRQGDHDRAIADFTEAIRLDPRLAVTYLNRGTALQSKEDFDRAIADYTEAIRLNPESAVALNNRGLALVEKEQYTRALEDFDAALRLEPKSAVIWNNRGLAASRKGDYGRAIADLTRAVTIDPNFAKGWFNRGAAYAKNGDRAKAASDRARARELDPNLTDD